MVRVSKIQVKNFANSLLQGMLQHNYLPNQKERRDELPRLLNSETLTPSVAEKIRSLPLRNGSHRGYDWVVYKSTRFNGVTRSLSIPHPLPYCRLAYKIYSYWDRLGYILENEHSMILPREYPDGRVLLMDYDDKSNARVAPSMESLGKKVKVYTDIANFYSSVYSHSIPWALVGVEQAKKTKGTKHWYNQLDAAIRQTHRGETLGLPTGPATSAILAETILAKVDQKLHGKFVFHRYMDDYVAFCENQQDAETFVLCLEGLLGEYGLRVNAGKTLTLPLPVTTSDDWHVDLRQAFAARGRGARGLSDCLNLAVRLSSGFPDGSVLKYALTAAAGRSLGETGTSKEVDMVLKYGLEWGVHNASVVPVLCTLWSQAKELALEDATEANWRALVQAHIVTGHYDAVAWLLELGFKHKYRLPARHAKDILQSQDCVAILLLYIAGSPKQKREVVGFCKNLNAKDVYLLDQYWLLLYQLFTWGRIGNPYSSDDTFEVMKAEGVDFVGHAG